ncbi:Gfo/Idh/MocA family protein [Parvularcula lutaonensis]|uniref:Gfo/Idh/MocA family protein n=1 Tax=Parvularcula lutaonensis TaxID=491923 RepID=A0ABV7MCM2_9PROT|nr:Gfo/Idh/MocA family oxidoreductase [Parvularcula lutaonensis]GGY51176.1 oxidoreductase [Parvularcula lutaonensis]
MTDVLKAGVAGAGVFGGYHANKYAETEGAELVAIYDHDIERAKERADKFGAKGFDNYDAFLAQVDVLTIATPATTHASLAAKAIAAGKHVLVEKPIAMTVDEADALIEAAEAKGVFIQVGHQERYVAAAFGLFDREVPQKVTSRRMNRYSPRAGDVSVVLDLMIHDLDLLAQLTGRSDADILRIESRKEKGDFADYVDVTLDIGGVQARLIASRLEDDPVRDLRMEYLDGQVHLDFLKREVANTTPEPVAADFSGDDLPLALKDPLGFGTESFLAAVRSGVSPAVPGQAGRRALAMALAIEEAIDA